MAKRVPKEAAPAEAGPGHNNPPADQALAVANLRKALERVEKLNETIKDLTDDRKDIFAELKGLGYDTAAFREIVKVRSLNESALGKYREKRNMVDLYAEALGVNIGDPAFTGDKGE